MALSFFYVSKHHSVFICEMFLFFYVFYFFYTQLTFVFHLLRDFYIICKQIIIATFCHFLFFSSSEGFWHLLGAFLKFFFGCLVIFSWLFFKNFYLWKRFYVKKIVKIWFKTFYCIITINFYKSLENHLKIYWIALKIIFFNYNYIDTWRWWKEVEVVLVKKQFFSTSFSLRPFSREFFSIKFWSIIWCQKKE